MTKLVAVVLIIICILLVREGVKYKNIASPSDYITISRYIGGATLLLILAVALFKTDKIRQYKKYFLF